MSTRKKRIVYLFGAGATEAVVKVIDPEKGLLTSDIRTKIEELFARKAHVIDDLLWNELLSTTSNIEHLISILEYQNDFEASHVIRGYYRSALQDLARPFSDNPPALNLYTVLGDLHLNVDKKEELSCILTLNYEDVLEQSLVKHLGCKLNYGIEADTNSADAQVTVLKLHGSFSWVNCRPIQTGSGSGSNPEKALWIPPGVGKHIGNYPFNLLWGKAAECLMMAEVVRVVGCSLSHNDWGLVPLLYAAQKLSGRRPPLAIELIDFDSVCETISDNYRYLNFTKITQIDDVVAYHKRTFPQASAEDLAAELKANFSDSAKGNPFSAWLQAKIDCLVEDDEIDISTEKKFVHSFYYEDGSHEKA